MTDVQRDNAAGAETSCRALTRHRVIMEPKEPMTDARRRSAHEKTPALQDKAGVNAE
jgi:hypothetical protein